MLLSPKDCVGKFCVNCKKEITVPMDLLIRLGFSEKTAREIKIFEGKGCEKCSGIGHKGRLAIYEVFPVTPSIKSLVLKKASSDELKNQAIREGMKTLRMSALINLAKGLITIEEVLNTSASDKSD